MAQYNEILAGRFNRAIQKFLSMKGGPPAAQLAGDIAFTFEFPLGNDFRFLEGWQRWGATTTILGGAGQTSQVRLRNPLTSGIVAVVEKITIGNPGAAAVFTVEQHQTNIDLTTTQTSIPLDIRQSTFGGTSKFSFTANGVIAGFQIEVIRLLTNVTQSLIISPNQELTLLPGHALSILDNTVAATMDVVLQWRERTLEASEVT